ncbi:MAG: FAA hydrolase family protein [SAR86 cluster bacterium]|uniref:FAA hydrolase family protein n=1 Tax=SAR86 cluster bacterium TaxID=2030880 RepID=A0A368BXV4_9GAMM|nr:MAG: FAA hydrolase family protein [SAR86 cluster bacterium]
MGAENKLSFEFNPIVRGMKIAESNTLFPIHRVFCVGKNYAEHAKEMGSKVEKKEPFFFSKVPESVTQVDEILVPEDTANLHHEVELVVCLKKGGMNINVDAAHQCIFGYAVGVDLTKRDIQKNSKDKGHPWESAKSFDQSGPISYIKKYEEVVLKNNNISLSVNGEEKQNSSVDNMVWGIEELISILSKKIILKPGDILFTGTPAGVSKINKGDFIEANIQEVGQLELNFN